MGLRNLNSILLYENPVMNFEMGWTQANARTQIFEMLGVDPIIKKTTNV